MIMNPRKKRSIRERISPTENKIPFKSIIAPGLSAVVGFFVFCIEDDVSSRPNKSVGVVATYKRVLCKEEEDGLTFDHG